MVLGTFYGPMLGLFALGALFPFANSKVRLILSNLASVNYPRSCNHSIHYPSTESHTPTPPPTRASTAQEMSSSAFVAEPQV